LTSDKDRQRAEKTFKRQEPGRHRRKALIEYEIHAVATREKTERLKALRLAKEAETQKSKKDK
jgi:hypothetical protein